MKLYFINASDNNGESMDLFVRADTPQEAFDFWKINDVAFGWTTCFEGVLSSEPAEEASVEDLRIFLIPVTYAAGAINWHTIHGVNIVAHVNPI